MIAARIAILTTMVAAAAIVVVLALSNSDRVSKPTSTQRTRVPEPATTTEPIPELRQEGLAPPPSDVVGIWKAQGEQRAEHPHGGSTEQI